MSKNHHPALQGVVAQQAAKAAKRVTDPPTIIPDYELFRLVVETHAGSKGESQRQARLRTVHDEEVDVRKTCIVMGGCSYCTPLEQSPEAV